MHDVEGGTVTTLAHGEVPAGRYSAVWDGTAASASRAPTGVYFARLVVRGDPGVETRICKVVLAK